MAKLRVWRTFSVVMALMLVVGMGAAIVPASPVKAANLGDVLINEFVSNPDAGESEWVELFNTTTSDIDLTGWYITKVVDGGAPEALPLALGLACSTTLPAQGILVFEPTGDWLPNSPTSCNITIFDGVPPGANGIYNVAYGTGTSLQPPSQGTSAARFDPDTWQTDQSTTKGWFNDAGQPGGAPLLSTIDADLAGQGITSNIGELPNPSATPTGDAGLFFEKTGQGGVILTTCLNLTNEATRDALENLGAMMEIAAASLKFDSDLATAMSALGAKLVMYGLDALGFTEMPNLIVKDDDGNVISPDDPNYPTITNKTYAAGTFTFYIDHFTQYEAVKAVAPPAEPPALPPKPRVSPTPPRPLNPPQMSVRYLSVSPQQTSANQPVTISTNVVNTGDEAGNYNVALKINGQVEQQKMVSVGPQGTQPVKFTVTKSQPGTYTVDVGGQKGSFTILGAGSGTTKTPVSGGTIAIIIVGMLVLATVVFLMLSFRRPA
ncbi:MAG: hypothetical protein FJ006_12620 [Chloroflexi bacterium]|nr:hypothetical protein [Chloroflexota bacterium]